MDLIFKALGDPARRAILDRLRKEDGRTLGQLEEMFEMSRFGVMKHLGVLEEAGLITTRREGRFKYHYLNALPLQEVVDRWVEPLIVGPTARSVLDLKAKLEDTSMAQPDFVMSTFIRCSQDALWHALTDAETMAAMHFMATDVRREGNELTYYMGPDQEMLICRETRLEPKTRIEANFEPKWDGPGMPISRYVYLLERQDAYCKLTIEHYGIPEGQEDIADGWARELSGLKTFLETGEIVKFAMEMEA
ncbi:MAG: metalloregulator ArsR/SmtB family transcription factor [Pseudomonadota bacterium]